ncbi:MAG TPA: D-alanine--D-alanine ligase [candidate division Zixibacteria bacterium]|nr:D-alanine--D-alanine ligase [candidate division Zixibacteria bacterium]
MKRKLRVAVLYGGKSAEHEISLISARNVVAAMDRRKYRVEAIAIDGRGRWYLDERQRLLSGGARRVPARRAGTLLAVLPGGGGRSLIPVSAHRALQAIDVVFPVLHGPFGEDGTVQGLLELMDLPFVGAGVLGSALGMDKDVMKRLLRDAGIPVARFLAFTSAERESIDFGSVRRLLGLPLFVKPANLGSSVGISKAGDRDEFERAVREAFRFDRKILVEQFVAGREIECSVLGNERPVASLPGEIVTRHEFYSYRAKYVDAHGAELVIPARLPERVVEAVRRTAVRTFQVLGCEGMARVDFFVKRGGRVVVNEINTIPGFTQISMYPKLWEASGVSYPALIDRLIELALERHRRLKALRTTR